MQTKFGASLRLLISLIVLAAGAGIVVPSSAMVIYSPTGNVPLRRVDQPLITPSAVVSTQSVH